MLFCVQVEFFFPCALEYKGELDERTRIASELIEDTIHVVCGSSNSVLDAKLQEVYSILDEIGE